MFALRPGIGQERRGLLPCPDLASGFVLPRWLRRPCVFCHACGFRRMRAATFRQRGHSTAGADRGLRLRCLGAMSAAHADRSAEHHRPHRLRRRSDQGNRQPRDFGNRCPGALELDGWTSLIGMDAENARERIAALPWVECLGAQGLSEYDRGQTRRTPAFRRLAANNELSVIEPSGKVIAPFAAAGCACCRWWSGRGADKSAEASWPRMKNSQIWPQAKVYLRVAERRWDRF